MRLHRLLWPLGSFAITLVCLVGSAAEKIDPARLMPPSAVAYVEVTQADLLLDKALDPGLHNLLEHAKDVKKYYGSPQYQQAKLGVALIEARMNAKWPAVLRDLAGSIHVAFDPQANAAVLVLRTKNGQTLEKLHSAIIDLVELDATSKGQPSPVKRKEYMGITGYSLAEGEFHALVDDLYLASNKVDALKGVVDRLKDASQPNLTGAAEYQKAKAGVAPGQAAWGMLRMSAVRELPKVNEAVSGQSNPLAELLLGGVLETLRDTPLLVSSLHNDQDEWRLKFQLPRVSPAREQRAWFFTNSETPLAPLKPKGTIASFLLDRDIAGMWMARDELFDEATRTKLAQADAGLGLYFAGRDFGTEVLGELGPQWQLLFTRQEFGGDQPVPSIKLPAVALVLQMKHPDQLANTMLLGYQKVIGLANLVGAEKGNPQLLMGGEDYQGVSVSKSTFLAPPDLDQHAASIHYNASPSCARVGDRFIFGTTIGIVKGAIDALKGSELPAAKGQLQFSVDLSQVAAALNDNRDALISQNMLQEGATREEATGDVGVLLHVLQVISQAGLRMNTEGDSLTLELSAGPK